MKALKYYGILTTALLFNFQIVTGQLLVDNSLPLDSLAKLISGRGVQILNPQMDCNTDGYGKYNATSSSLGISEGVLLTTGTIFNAPGPNDVGNKTTWFAPKLTPAGYPLLDTYTGRTTWEYCEFQFDIVPQGDTIRFDFVFASEEYEEWVGSQYNDVFAFFISGPGIVGDPGTGSEHNIALIPGTSTPVTINNVNQASNTGYYQNNDGDPTVQYDGFTSGLYAMSPVQPCDTFHLKLVVADVSDKLWDSGVFIEKIESNNVLLSVETDGNLKHMVEGCNDGTIVFKRQSVTAAPLVVDYWLTGTATNGVDYVAVGNPNPLTPKQVTIPAFDSIATVAISPIADGLSEVTEYISVYLGNPYCSSVIVDSLNFFIWDSLYSAVAPLKDSICAGESIELIATGGSVYSWTPVTGINDPASDTVTASPIVSTIYTVAIGASTCLETQVIPISVSDLNTSVDSTDVLCYGNNDGTIDLTAITGFVPYSYSWTGPSAFTSTLEDLTSLAAGNYNVTVTDILGCTDSVSTLITEPPVLLSSITSPVFNGGYHVPCFADSLGTADLSASGGITPYAITWTGPGAYTSSTEDLSGISAGTYLVTVTDSNNCEVFDTIVLTEPTVLSVGSIATAASCDGDCDGGINLTPAGGTTPYIFNWSNGAATEDLIGLCASSYSYTITDDNNCETSNTISVTEPAEIVLTTAAVTSNCGQPNGEVSVTILGGIPPYAIQWDDSLSSTDSIATGLKAGIYNVTVSDSIGCLAYSSTVVNDVPGGISSTLLSSAVSCKSACDGQSTAVMAGGAAPFTYSWSTGDTTATISNLCAGTYNVTVTDSVGCSTPSSILISEPTALTGTLDSTNALCKSSCDGEASAIAAGGTAPYSYLWEGGQTDSTIFALCAGFYNITITDSNGCSLVDSIEIIEPDTVSVTFLSPVIIGGYNISCFGDSSASVDLTAIGGTPSYVYSWAGPGGYVSSLEDITSLVAGTYHITITDLNACTIVDSTVLTEPNDLASSIISPTGPCGYHISCFGYNDASVDLTITGGNAPYSYSWIGPSSFSATTEDCSGLLMGSYYLTVTDTNGCATVDSIVITQPQALTNSINASTFTGGYHTSCNGASDGLASAVASGGCSPFNYQWIGPNAFTATTPSISGVVEGSYSLTVTDASGCTVLDTVGLTQPDSLSLELSTNVLIGGYNIACLGDSTGYIETSISGGIEGYEYLWNGPGGYTSLSADVGGLPAGQYLVTVTDTNGCAVMDSLTLVDPDSAFTGVLAAFAYPGGTQISCYGMCDGSIDLSFTGGEPNYEIVWRGPDNFFSSSEDISGLCTGLYDVVVTDTNSCSIKLDMEITEPDSIILTYSAINDTCGEASGEIDLTVVGGSPIYAFNWSNGSTDEDPGGLGYGSYTVTITDINGCADSLYAIVLGVDPMTTISSVLDVLCFGESNGSINIDLSGGNSSYQYQWSNLATTEDISDLSYGAYYVTILDGIGCMITEDFMVNEPDELQIYLYSPAILEDFNTSAYEAEDGSIDLTVTGGTVPYQFLWSNGSTGEDLSFIPAGEYTIVVTDDNGCDITGNIELTGPFVLSLPTVITPNSDGFNDYFIIHGIESYPTNDLTIFNRWGNVVYHMKDYKNQWNGVNRDGNPLPDGTYFTILNISNGEIKQTGYLDVIRE